MNAYDKQKRNKFIRFLKKNNIYEKFMYCFNNRHCSENVYFRMDKINSFITYIAVTHYEDLFVNCFHWKETKDGYKFWKQYSEMWIRERLPIGN